MRHQAQRRARNGYIVTSRIVRDDAKVQIILHYTSDENYMYPRCHRNSNYSPTLFQQIHPMHAVSEIDLILNDFSVPPGTNGYH